jgi:murein DD-endopeptidase MepM/ murein hydrolase activator NlpD
MKNILEIISTVESAKVILKEMDYSNYVSLDLSDSNDDLKSRNLNTATDYENYISEYLNLHDAKIAFGGYQETRNLYKRSGVFNNQTSDERNIHIGLDLWINASAPIFAALDGEIHSFKNNDALGDYGPTIILKHQIEDFTFHTLYGHLSLESISDKKVGDFVKKGEKIGALGLPPINGDYAPHLHFQIIIDLENNLGDYPGVCSQNKLAFYANNCPDPNLLLKIK